MFDCRKTSKENARSYSQDYFCIATSQNLCVPLQHPSTVQTMTILPGVGVDTLVFVVVYIEVEIEAGVALVVVVFVVIFVVIVDVVFLTVV